MYANPHLTGELVRERQRELLAHAERRRLSHSSGWTAQLSQQRRRPLRRAVRAAARLRAAFQA